jgi:hypothetical protein
MKAVGSRSSTLTATPRRAPDELGGVLALTGDVSSETDVAGYFAEAVENADAGVRVDAVVPGPIETALFRRPRSPRSCSVTTRRSSPARRTRSTAASWPRPSDPFW